MRGFPQSHLLFLNIFIIFEYIFMISAGFYKKTTFQPQLDCTPPGTAIFDTNSPKVCTLHT